nr:acyl-CoA dehydrogenase [Actinomycetota bacterium]
MDVRLTSEQRQLREAAAKLADDLGPASVADLDDDSRIVRLEKTVESTGWRSLRSDEASGVEVALVVEEFARGLVDVPFVGPVLNDDLGRRLGREMPTPATEESSVDLTGSLAGVLESPSELAELAPEDADRWYALALTASTADLVGSARGTLALATDYAKLREQYGSTIGSYQAIGHLLAESLALIEGSVSVLRHAAWAVDELPIAQAVEAGRVAKIYCARSALTVCETSIQVHGGIGNTWECLAHVYLRRVLTATESWPVRLEE